MVRQLGFPDLSKTLKKLTKVSSKVIEMNKNMPVKYGCHGNVKSHGQSHVISYCSQIILENVAKTGSVCFIIKKVFNVQSHCGQNPRPPNLAGLNKVKMIEKSENRCYQAWQHICLVAKPELPHSYLMDQRFCFCHESIPYM